MVKRLGLVLVVGILGFQLVAWQRVPLTGQPAPPPSGGGSGAPTTSEYLVGALDAGLSAERLVTGTSTITWDLGTAGQAKANVPNSAITYAKIQNVAATTVLGRATAGAGVVEEIPCTSFARTILDDIDAAAVRTTIGAGTGNGTVTSVTGTAPIASSGGAAPAISLNDNGVTYAKMQDVSTTARFLGRITAGAGDTEELTGTQATTLLDAFTSVLKGLVPASGGGTVNFLRADGTWQNPPDVMKTLRTTADQTINAGAGTFVDITGLTFTVVSGTDYAFHYYITFRSAQTTTGWKAGINHPGGTVDFWASSQTIANAAAGAATHTTRHNVVVDDMTLLTSTVTNNVDLAIIIEGRYKCTANGTFAARFANELAANTDVVVQKGSWGWWF